MRSLLCSMLVFATGLGLASDVWACAPLNVPAEGTPPSDSPYTTAYQMLIAWEGGFEDPATIVLSSDVYSAADGAGFVIPVPQAIGPEDVSVEDVALLDGLRVFTGPRSLTASCADFRPDVELVCENRWEAQAGGDGGAGNEWLDNEGVTVDASFEVGVYDVSVLSAEGADGLLAWLDAEGLALPAGASDIVDQYIAQDYVFVAVRVPAGEEIADGSVLPALSMRLDGGLPSLPLLLGASGAKTAQDVFVTTWAPEIGAVGVSNWKEVTPESRCMLREEGLGAAQAALFNDSHATAGEAVWALEYFSPWSADDFDTGATSQVNLSGDSADAVRDWFGGMPAKMGRLHLRYSPGEALQDPVFYALAESGFRAPEYYTWNVELTEFLPVCGEGFVAEGSCPETIMDDRYCADDDEKDDKSGCATASGVPGAAWSLGLLGLVGAFLRRRP